MICIEEEIRMIYKLNPLQYSNVIDVAAVHDCGSVYPLSIAESIQEGEIFTNSVKDYENLLFWAHSGFAYLSGNVDEYFMEDIYEFMLDRNKSGMRRFLLMTRNKYIQEYFEKKNDTIIEKRYLFQYSGDKEFAEPSLPAGYKLQEINHELLKKISGKIVPSLFWKDANDFLKKGKGYCIIGEKNIASWAFSASVSSKEIDIGIETNSKYKKQGLGIIVAKAMIRYILEQAKEPVWACHYKNIASEKMAQRLGFIKGAECFVIQRKD